MCRIGEQRGRALPCPELLAGPADKARFRSRELTARLSARVALVTGLTAASAAVAHAVTRDSQHGDTRRRIESVAHALRALPQLVPPRLLSDLSAGVIPDRDWVHLRDWWQRVCPPVEAAEQTSALEYRRRTEASQRDLFRQVMQKNRPLAADPQLAMVGLRELFPDRPRPVLEEILRWASKPALVENASLLGPVLDGSQRSAIGLLSYRIFADGLPLADQGFLLRGDALTQALSSWRSVKLPSWPSAKLRRSQQKNLESGHRLVQATLTRANQVARAWGADAETKLRLDNLEHVARQFRVILRGNRVSRQTLWELAADYSHALDMNARRPSVRVPRAMPLFTATAQHWSFEELYHWLQLGIVPVEHPHPLKPYDREIGSSRDYSAHDAKGHWLRLVESPEWRRDWRRMRKYIERERDVGRRAVLRATLARATWDFRGGRVGLAQIENLTALEESSVADAARELRSRLRR